MKPLKRVVAVLLLLSLALSACDNLSHVSIGYQPPGVPVRLVVNGDGSVSLEGSEEWITPLGTFSIGASYELTERNKLLLVLRDRNHQTDEVFEIQKDKFFMSLDGSARIEASDNKIIIDITNARVQTISFLPRSQLGELSPEDVVANYWAYVGSKNYYLSWPLLSSGFRERNHHSDIEDYIQGYEELDLCNVEAKQVYLDSLEGSRAFVNARVVYYKGANCVKYAYDFSHELIEEDGEWRIEHVRYR